MIGVVYLGLAAINIWYQQNNPLKNELLELFCAYVTFKELSGLPLFRAA